ncbi:MAG TPA: hypothetical protein VLB82_02580 [Thermodesulfobacteriota bacterium]|nr:hypothetical protein [Thermodesulfobacteriota bacterium]
MPQNSRQVFRTHSNYLNAIRYIASGGIEDNNQKSLELLAEKVFESGCLKLEKKTEFNTNDIHHSLNNAWGVEALYKMGNLFIKEDDLIRLSNNWCIVQTYYALYYSTQALAITEGYPKPRTHAQVQKIFYVMWSEISWLITPWCISFDENGFHNLAPGIYPDDHIHSWKKVEDESALSLFCKALRTTREEYISEALAKRRDRLAKKKDTSTVKLTDEQKMQTITRVRPTTLMSYLFRLKRKTNYEQSSILAIGPQNEFQSQELRNNLSFIIESTLLITEFIISRLIGEDIYYNWCREWEKYKAPAFDHIGPEERFEIVF